MKFIISVNYIAWLLVSMVFYAAGEFFSKKFALQPRPMTVALVLLAYSLGVLAWLLALLQKNQLAIVGVMWAVMSLAVTVSIGLLVFGEKLSVVGAVGIIAAVVAVVLLSLA